MATQALLSDPIQQFQAIQPDTTVSLVSVGGVSTAQRVQAGEVFDVVALAANAIEQLSVSGKRSAVGRQPNRPGSLGRGPGHAHGKPNPRHRDQNRDS